MLPLLLLGAVEAGARVPVTPVLLTGDPLPGGGTVNGVLEAALTTDGRRNAHPRARRAS
ncbi:MAG: hypothetical protein QNK03_18780 [Myxococcota bacterium]|nr:hypothetical protein [Myxococcota bacterium]